MQIIKFSAWSPQIIWTVFHFLVYAVYNYSKPYITSPESTCALTHLFRSLSEQIRGHLIPINEHCNSCDAVSSTMGSYHFMLRQSENYKGEIQLPDVEPPERLSTQNGMQQWEVIAWHEKLDNRDRSVLQTLDYVSCVLFTHLDYNIQTFII